MHYTSAPDRDLGVHDTVALVYKGATYICTVDENCCKIKYFLSLVGGNNSIPLCAAFGADYKRTVADIYGYTSDGDCPEAKTLSDLTRLVRAMFARCDKVETQRPAFAIGQKWRRRDGQAVLIDQMDSSWIPVHAQLVDRNDGRWYRNDGRAADGSQYDLVEFLGWTGDTVAKADSCEPTNQTPGRMEVHVAGTWNGAPLTGSIQTATQPAPGILCLDGVRVGAVGETRDGRMVTLEQVGFSEGYPYRWSHDTTKANGASSIWGQRNNDIIRIISNGPEVKPEPKRVEVRVGMLARHRDYHAGVIVGRDGGWHLVASQYYPDGTPRLIYDDTEVRWPWEPESAWRRVDGR